MLQLQRVNPTTVPYLRSITDWTVKEESDNKYSDEMSRPNQPERPRAAPIFKVPSTPAPLNPIPSSSPAFATPAHPIKPYHGGAPPKPSILPVLLPPATLRPLAFRVFTKKHSLTLTSSALQTLATFVGKHCGAEWREKGLAEQVLDEVARTWKRVSAGVIVEGDGKELKDILKSLEGLMSGGRIEQSRTLSRQNSLASADSQNVNGLGRLRPDTLSREDSTGSLGFSSLDVDEDEELDDNQDPRQWLQVVDAYIQPRLVYNVSKKHFDKDPTKPSLLPPPSHKTQVFRNRYNLIHQRLLRNESFQTPSMERGPVPSLSRGASSLATTQQAYKITPINNLLGRNNTPHLLLGLLDISPTGTLAINDLTGSIQLDLSHAKAVPEDGAWFVPGMIVLVDGIYEEEDTVGSGLGGGGGVGGTIGGKFIGLTVGGPPCERRQLTLGLSSSNNKGDITAGGGFGWVDFLGVGSERAIGSKMRNIEQKLLPKDEAGQGRGRMVIVGEVNLDQPRCLQALAKVLGSYATEAEEDTPMTFVLMGNFVQYAVMARGGSGGSVEYKEYFDALASTLSEYPGLLQSATFIFVPGDNDGWVSSFTAGAAAPIPRKPIPEMFTNRIRRAFATANADAAKGQKSKTEGEAIWASNPSRMTLFGPTHEIVLFRDDMTSRLRRNAVRFSSSSTAVVDEMDVDVSIEEAEAIQPDQDFKQPGLKDTEAESLPDHIHQARKLVKTILDQAYLSPFRIQHRPVLWDYASSLHLYPLPTAMVLCDKDIAAFVVTYEGCCVLNPGTLVAPGRRGVAKWCEYDLAKRIGQVKEIQF